MPEVVSDNGPRVSLLDLHSTASRTPYLKRQKQPFQKKNKMSREFNKRLFAYTPVGQAQSDAHWIEDGDIWALSDWSGIDVQQSTNMFCLVISVGSARTLLQNENVVVVIALSSNCERDAISGKRLLDQPSNMFLPAAQTHLAEDYFALCGEPFRIDPVRRIRQASRAASIGFFNKGRLERTLTAAMDILRDPAAMLSQPQPHYYLGFQVGEVWLVQLKGALGCEERGKQQQEERPVIVVSVGEDRVVGVPLTSNMHREFGQKRLVLGQHPWNVLLNRGNGIRYDSFALCRQILTFDPASYQRIRSDRPLGRIAAGDLARIKNAVQAMILT